MLKEHYQSTPFKSDYELQYHYIKIHLLYLSILSRPNRASMFHNSDCYMFKTFVCFMMSLLLSLVLLQPVFTFLCHKNSKYGYLIPRGETGWLGNVCSADCVTSRKNNTVVFQNLFLKSCFRDLHVQQKHVIKPFGLASSKSMSDFSFHQCKEGKFTTEDTQVVKAVCFPVIQIPFSSFLAFLS